MAGGQQLSELDWRERVFTHMMVALPSLQPRDYALLTHRGLALDHLSSRLVREVLERAGYTNQLAPGLPYIKTAIYVDSKGEGGVSAVPDVDDESYYIWHFYEAK